ncbi:MAG TPA: hypothetical protein HA257_01665 [Candidatus Methanoperedenaceae archaeon]|nr:hypothetical protein [Candidatus Methanoperedenaceae archaeon]
MNKLIDFWEKYIENLKKEQMPVAHPSDKIGKEYYYACKNFDDYIKLIKSPNIKFENRFHLGLIPIPYIGNIEKAEIYILMLNPGFGILDYYAESYDKELKDALINNLRQELDNDYPFIFLNPKFLWHGGGQYYEKKFKWLIQEVKGTNSYAQKLSHIANKVAVLQLVPYHSKSYIHNHTIELESSKIMCSFVKKELVPKTEDGDICIICPRGANYWENATCNTKAFVCPDTPSRAGHISKNTFGEKNWEKIIMVLNKS